MIPGRQADRAAPAPDDVRGHLGRVATADWVLGKRDVAEFVAVLGPFLAEGIDPPLGLHFAFPPVPQPQSALGPDGLPASDGLRPPLPYPHRRAAGGELHLPGLLPLGGRIVRRSSLLDIQFKPGRSGPLCITRVSHDYLAPQLVLKEVQTTVFCHAQPAPTAATAALDASPAKACARTAVEFTGLLLFRYSALTGNTHRIHFDERYAREEEGFDGLVVHGPLQATVLMNAAATLAGRAPTRFSYRATAALTAGPATVCTSRLDDHRIRCWMERSDGLATMTGEAFILPDRNRPGQHCSETGGRNL